MAKNSSNMPFGGERLPSQGPFVGRMLREYRFYRALLVDPRTPPVAKWLIGSGVGYVMLPVDLIPDFLPVIGKLDDVLIASALIGLGLKLVPERVKSDNRNRSRRIRKFRRDQKPGSVLFESSALPGPFGIRIEAGDLDARTQGPVFYPLVELIAEYGLVIAADNQESYDSIVIQTKTNALSGMNKIQEQLDVNFRPMPQITELMFHNSRSAKSIRFVNTESAYAALPPDLGRQLSRLRLRWIPCSAMQLDAVLIDEQQGQQHSQGAHLITGGQFINLLMNEDCHIVDLSDTATGKLLTKLRRHVLQDAFCYTHRSSPDELIAWNPRKILFIPSEPGTKTQRFVYPEYLSETYFFH